MNDSAEIISLVNSAPHDGDLERTLLAAVIADNAILDSLSNFEPEMLHDPIHAAILAAALDLRAEGRPVNLITLKPRFGGVALPDGGTVFDYLRKFEFAGALPAISDVTAALRELDLRREIQSLGERLAGSVWDNGIGPQTLLQDVSQEIATLVAKTTVKGITRRSMADCVAFLMDTLLNPDDGGKVSTGLHDLDWLIGGWRPGEYTLLAGRPSQGKSTVAACMARQVAAQGYGVLVFSLEMTTHQWTARTVCDALWSSERRLAYTDVLRGRLTDSDLYAFSEAARKIQTMPLVVEEQAGLSVQDILARSRMVAQQFQNDGKKLALVVVDHIGKIRPSPRYKGNRVMEIGEISDGMAQLAKDEQAHVLVLSQLNRAVEGRENKRPALSDLRDSGTLEQDADNVMFPYRPAYYLERAKEDDADKELNRLTQLGKVQNLLELNIAKQRNGPTGNIELFVDMASNAIRELAKDRTENHQ